MCFDELSLAFLHPAEFKSRTRTLVKYIAPVQTGMGSDILVQMHVRRCCIAKPNSEWRFTILLSIILERCSKIPVTVDL